MKIYTLPVLRDNYIHFLVDADTGQAAVIDPPVSLPVQDMLARNGWRLTHILNTHHHWDHVGGNHELKRATGCQVIGMHKGNEIIPDLDVLVREGDRFILGNLDVTVMEVPGHTQGHIGYWLPAEKALFCGDTLFGMGCGRLLGGTAEQLWTSLARLRQLPADTKVYCAHEYTQNNGRFALTVENGNPALIGRMKSVDRRRAENLPTVPFTIQEELQTNPFLRPESPEIRQVLGMPDASNQEIFRELRSRKDAF
ncbi:MAG: hydroxyacylglutathione hydrolase [Methylococcus sp.]